VNRCFRALSLAPTYREDGALDVKRLLHARKRLLRLLIAAAVVVLLFHRPLWPHDSAAHSLLTRGGMLLIAITIAGRTWVWAQLGRRKHAHFVSDGPYSVVRHPLYSFSLLGAAGIGAQTGSIVITLVTTAIVWAIFNQVGRLEEEDMAARFGDPYRAYVARTRRFLPRWSLWSSGEHATGETRHVLDGFGNAALFALAIPALWAVDWAHRVSLFPVLFCLP
jgi:protein-S-isoprenylcysteine O-methyltransferase Ste14